MTSGQGAGNGGTKDACQEESFLFEIIGILLEMDFIQN